MKKTVLFFLLAGLLSACSVSKKENLSEQQRAAAILKSTPIIDTHIDFPWHLVERNKYLKPDYTAYALYNPEGDFDLERARKGGLYGPFMSIYIPSKYQSEAGRSKQVADSLIDMVHAIARAYPDKFALAFRADDVVRQFERGIVSLPMGMENGSPIEQLTDVAYFQQRGIRYVTLTHGKDNKISDSSYDTTHTHGGLSSYGRAVVREMNRVGIMVDVSHLSDDAIWDVLEVAQKPLIATHSGCRHFTPGFERNLPDTLLRAIARTGGVVQVPFSMYFLSTQHRAAFQKAETELNKAGIPETDPKAKIFLSEYAQRSGEPVYASVKTVADHIDHIVQVAGIDHVGLGSDFDGVGLSLPPDLADVSMYPNLIVELLHRGYSDADIKKICSGNVLRVWKANETMGR